MSDSKTENQQETVPVEIDTEDETENILSIMKALPKKFQF